MKFKTCLIAILTSTIVYGIAPAIAQDDPTLDIRSVDCRTLLKMDEDEKDFTLIFLHGFMSGKADNMIFDGPTFKAATDAIIENCIDNPTAKLLDVFGKHR